MKPTLGDMVRMAKDDLPPIDSQRITLTEISPAEPETVKAVKSVLNAIPNRHRASVVKTAILVIGVLIGIALAKGVPIPWLK